MFHHLLYSITLNILLSRANQHESCCKTFFAFASHVSSAPLNHSQYSSEQSESCWNSFEHSSWFAFAAKVLKVRSLLAGEEGESSSGGRKQQHCEQKFNWVENIPKNTTFWWNLQTKSIEFKTQHSLLAKVESSFKHVSRCPPMARVFLVPRAEKSFSPQVGIC